MTRLTRERVGNQQAVNTIEVSATDSNSIERRLHQSRTSWPCSTRLSLARLTISPFSRKPIFCRRQPQVTGVLTVFLGAIAGISLVVGGIGVMNIMMVSVTERTREIGLRKAVGARRRDILYQFLTETLVLSVLGGIVGILVGAGISELVNASGAIATVVSAESVVLAFGFSAAVGIFFGSIRPTERRASSQLKPSGTNSRTADFRQREIAWRQIQQTTTRRCR
jgi:hypothetical protein